MEYGTIPGLKLPAKNTSGSTIEGKRFVKKTTGTDFEVTKTAATTDPIVGVTDRDIVNNDVGNIIVSGLVPVTCAEAITAGDKVGCDNAGKATVWAASGGESLAGIAYTTTTGGDQTVMVLLQGPGSYGVT